MIPRAYLAAIVAIVITSAVLAAVTASRVPDPAPIHWNFRGEVDGHGPKWLAVGLFPALTALFAGILVLLPRFGALGPDAARWIVPYSRIALGIVLLMASIGALFVFGAADADFDVPGIVMLPVGLFLAFVGATMRGIGRNAWMGIRTPWTLGSDAVWDATHRVGSRLMVAVGLLTAAAAIVLPIWGALFVLFAGVVALLVWSFVYSRRVHLRLGEATSEVHRR